MIFFYVRYWDDVEFLFGRKWYSRCKKSRVGNYLEMGKIIMLRIVDCIRSVGIIEIL